jgi:hypothetical protein
VITQIFYASFFKSIELFTKASILIQIFRTSFLSVCELFTFHSGLSKIDNEPKMPFEWTKLYYWETGSEFLG